MEKQILSLGKIFQKANVFGPETLSEKFFVGKNRLHQNLNVRSNLIIVFANYMQTDDKTIK